MGENGEEVGLNGKGGKGRLNGAVVGGLQLPHFLRASGCSPWKKKDFRVRVFFLGFSYGCIFFGSFFLVEDALYL